MGIFQRSLQNFYTKMENRRQSANSSMHMSQDDNAADQLKDAEQSGTRPQAHAEISNSSQLHNELNENLSQLSQPETSHKDSNDFKQINVMQPPTSNKKPKFQYYNTNMEIYTLYPNNQDYFNQAYREHFVQSFHALGFCKLLPQLSDEAIKAKAITLGQKKKNHLKTIVFDLDETLIHCNESVDAKCDQILPIQFPTGEIIEAGINVRPFAIEVLKELSKCFEIIVFTASHSCYAAKVLEFLDPENSFIHHKMYRDQCITTEEGVHIKDLRVIADRDIRTIVIVDNAAYSFGYQIDNGIPIIPFYDNKSDQEMRFLADYLKQLLTVDDVRSLNRATFKMDQYSNFETLPEALLNIYGVQANDTTFVLQSQHELQ